MKEVKKKAKEAAYVVAGLGLCGWLVADHFWHSIKCKNCGKKCDGCRLDSVGKFKYDGFDISAEDIHKYQLYQCGNCRSINKLHWSVGVYKKTSLFLKKEKHNPLEGLFSEDEQKTIRKKIKNGTIFSGKS